MKKIIFVACIIIPLLFVACGPDEPILELVLEKNSIEVFEGETVTVSIKHGNGGYYVQSISPQGLIEAVCTERSVQISGIEYGTGTLIIADNEGKTATIAVSVSSNSFKRSVRKFSYKGLNIVFGETPNWTIAGVNEKEIELVSLGQKTSVYIVWKSSSSIELRQYTNGEEKKETLSIKNLGKDEKGYSHFLFEGGELVN
ncbi:MAG: hypothetical protein PHU61_02540 [Candidatus Absconditabacteria bacterium]|nr:hypothetical protein [Candidatus Absconditabacteria bacterium]MDD3868148.1 hypothetical protein [Candidatus Absconditabacteria bacterium]MDD4714534.1 hypothetical protein [Candidatus Absconditabacteria bacterium]